MRNRREAFVQTCTTIDLLSEHWRSVLRKQPERRPEAKSELMPLALTAVALYQHHDGHLRRLS